MPKPRNKEDLLAAAEENFQKLNQQVDSLIVVYLDLR